jgi:hypothetical protein
MPPLFTYIGVVQFEGHHLHQTSRVKNTTTIVKLFAESSGMAMVNQAMVCLCNTLLTMHWLRALLKVFVQQCKLAENIFFSLLIDFILVFLHWSIPKTLFVFVIHKHLAESITNTLKFC